MTDVNPQDWRSVADWARFDSSPRGREIRTIAETAPVVGPAAAISAYMETVMTNLARSEETDLRAALALWAGDIEGIDDPDNIIRVRYPQDQPQVRTEQGGSLFTRSAPKVHIEVPRLIVLADKRHAGLAYAGLDHNGYVQPVNWRLHERVYEGERYTVALLDRTETAKIPITHEPEQESP